MKRTISLVFVVISFLSLMGGLVVLVTRNRESRPHPVTEVRQEITDLRTLMLAEYRYREVVYFFERGRILGVPAGRREVLFAVEIVVIAGVDLTRGFDVSLSENQEALFVTLPPAEVLTIDADEESIEQYFATERLGRLDWLDVGDQLALSKEANRKDAVGRGLLADAEEHARRVVRELGRSAGYAEVNVRFRPQDGIRG